MKKTALFTLCSAMIVTMGCQGQATSSLAQRSLLSQSGQTSSLYGNAAAAAQQQAAMLAAASAAYPGYSDISASTEKKGFIDSAYEFFGGDPDNQNGKAQFKTGALIAAGTAAAALVGYGVYRLVTGSSQKRDMEREAERSTLSARREAAMEKISEQAANQQGLKARMDKDRETLQARVFAARLQTALFTRQAEKELKEKAEQESAKESGKPCASCKKSGSEAHSQLAELEQLLAAENAAEAKNDGGKPDAETDKLLGAIAGL